jgi:hypothetical protein
MTFPDALFVLRFRNRDEVVDAANGESITAFNARLYFDSIADHGGPI